jgi:translation elongation factor aEF-1 beta
MFLDVINAEHFLLIINVVVILRDHKMGIGTALFKIKLMPEDTSIDLDKMQKDAVVAVEKSGGKFTGFEIQEIAFGLKAVIISVRLTEDKSGEVMEANLAEISGVSSVEVIDYRRAVE